MNPWDTLHGIFTLISLGTTFPALTVCCLVMASWHGRYIEYCISKAKDPSLMLIAGVYIGFFGSMIDNSWWGVAWTLDYLAHPLRDFFFINGVYPNTVFRQGTVIWAGILHVSAENLSRKTLKARVEATQTSRRIIMGSVFVGIVYIGLLFASRTLS